MFTLFITIILILAVFSLMMCGDITEPHINKILPISSNFGRLENIRLVYLITLLLCIIPFFYLMNRSHNNLKIDIKSSWKLLTFKFLLIHPHYNDILHGFTYNGYEYIAAFVFLNLWILFKIYKPFKIA